MHFKAIPKQNKSNKQIYIAIQKKSLSKLTKKKFESMVKDNKPFKFSFGDDVTW